MRIGVLGSNFGHKVVAPSFRRAGWDIKLLERNNDFIGLDAVAVAQPPQISGDAILRAAELQLPIFAEKPLALTSDEALKFQHFNGAVDFCYAELPAFQALFEECRLVGLPDKVRVFWHISAAASPGWKSETSALLTHGLHILDIWHKLGIDKVHVGENAFVSNFVSGQWSFTFSRSHEGQSFQEWQIEWPDQRAVLTNRGGEDVADFRFDLRRGNDLINSVRRSFCSKGLEDGIMKLAKNFAYSCRTGRFEKNTFADCAVMLRMLEEGSKK